MTTTPSLEDIAATFQSVDEEMRLELLLDYSRRLPALPERLHAAREAGLHRVPECMTPVFLLLELEDGLLRARIDVADEAPTVRGVMSIVHAAIDGREPDVGASVPLDLLRLLGLQGQIRMQRALGIASMLERIRRESQALIEQAGAS